VDLERGMVKQGRKKKEMRYAAQSEKKMHAKKKKKDLSS
jgi:hypothetical protein